MFNLKGVIVMVIDAEPKRTVVAEIKRRVQAGQCLEKDCDKKAAKGRRGLCQTHYTQFNNSINELADDKAKATAEANLIRDGQILKSGELRKKYNSFREKINAT